MPLPCAVQESAALDVYGEWVPVDKTTSKTTVETISTPASSDTVPTTGQCDAAQQAAAVAVADCVFNDQVLPVSPGRLVVSCSLTPVGQCFTLQFETVSV